MVGVVGVASPVPPGPAGVGEVVGTGAVCDAGAAVFGVASPSPLVAVMEAIMAAATAGSAEADVDRVQVAVLGGDQQVQEREQARRVLALGEVHLGGGVAQDLVALSGGLCLGEAGGALEPHTVDQGRLGQNEFAGVREHRSFEELGRREVCTTAGFAFGRPDLGQRPGAGQPDGHALVGGGAPAAWDARLRLGM